ncbi:palmitoyltransferase ZDHHC20-B isoform X3 [Chrysoperla carnea]|uniref:palmitoyltransferase ZDHHC20-B isoform X3 n=1 Tax=Chrysoperla carnea TaxID=189513 RepID=UPI001D083282|nr:palmitoyltransferase ZDHHC20-B isoform X3 [Chrysoperla carnea]
MTRELHLDYPTGAVSSGHRKSPGFCRMCINALKWLPVLLITTIVVWSYYAYVVQLCIFNIKGMLERIAYLIFYHIFFLMFLWSYWQTVFTNIGEVPSKFKVPPAVLDRLVKCDTDQQQRRILEDFAKNLPLANTTEVGSVRYCDKCHHVKPDRAHHCSVCGKCVLKMDHHCPWVNNCVSFYNYKFFILFLGYSLLYCLYIGLTSLRYFIYFWRVRISGELEGFGRFHILFLFFVALMFAISLVSLFGYHCCLVYNNRTTLEAFRAPYFRTGEDKNGFNVGHCKNFQEVFGTKSKLWFLPVYTSLGDGLGFPTRQIDEDSEQLLSPSPFYSLQ